MNKIDRKVTFLMLSLELTNSKEALQEMYDGISKRISDMQSTLSILEADIANDTE